MYADHPIESLAFALHDSINHFEKVTYQDRDWEKYAAWQDSVKNLDRTDKRRVEVPDECWITKVRPIQTSEVEIISMFEQTWGSTALAYGGMGGAAMTTAHTIILQSKKSGEFCVYIGQRLAYLIKYPSQEFCKDIADRCMKAVSKSDGYHEKQS